MKFLKERIFGQWQTTLAALFVLYIGYLHHEGKIEIGPLSLDEIGPAVTAVILFLMRDWKPKKEADK